MAIKSSRHLNSLTSLRFIAAFLVVGFHFFSFEENLLFLNAIFRRGYLGVDFFFILSGFVLALRYREDAIAGIFDKRKFLVFRMARIAPAYYLSLLLGVASLVRGFSLSEYLAPAENRFAFILSNLTFTQSLLPVNALIEHWNVPAWSLSVEFFFYLTFPFLSLRLLTSPKAFHLLAFCFLSSAACFMAVELLPRTVPFMGHESKISWINSFFFRLPEFLLGNALAIAFLKDYGKTFKTEGLVLGVILALTVLFAPMPAKMAETGSPLMVASFSLLIYFVAMNDEGKGIFNDTRLISLGEASYALYICQAPLKLYYQQFFSKILGGTTTSGPLYVAYLSVSLVATSVFIYKYFELPMNRYLRMKLT